MTEEPREYFSYLLRLWKVRGTGPPVWRASLEDVHTGERIGFADLQGLLKFLEEQTNEADQFAANEKGPQL
jgi:hypothetical protein